ncbi:hypothetical protein GW932_00865 [archaeon]|nr:hypothetical protein [archaeon]
MSKHRTIKKPDNLFSNVGVDDAFREDYKEIFETSKFKRELTNPILIEKAITHAKQEERGYENKNTIVLVHPFHFLNHKLDFSKYQKKLEFVLKNSYPDFSLVLYESYLDYLGKTAKLATQGCFDKIIFSKQDSGFPINEFELIYFNDKFVYVAGLYNGGCIGTTLTEITENSTSRKIRAIKDLILNDPAISKDKINPKKIYDRWSNKAKTTTLSDLFEDKYEMNF